MATFLDSLGGPGGLFGGVASLLGTVAGVNNEKQAAKARQLALQQEQTAGLQGLEGNYITGTKNLYNEGGVGNDALTNTVSNLGANLAAGGVYNPSVVGGAAVAGANGLNANLQAQGDALAGQRTQGLSALNSHIAGEQLGMADQNWYNALQQKQQAEGGLMSFLGALAQKNLARSGANALKINQPQMNGTGGDWGANAPGNTAPLPTGYGLGPPPMAGSSIAPQPQTFAPTPLSINPTPYRPYSKVVRDSLQLR